VSQNISTFITKSVKETIAESLSPSALKSDRKRLKTEKVELLHQMKQLYVTLEDKESELRDFIRNYEQRVQESDETIKQVCRSYLNYSQTVKEHSVNQAQFLLSNHRVLNLFCPGALTPWLLVSYLWTMLSVRLPCFTFSASFCQKKKNLQWQKC
jgi:hypothetical protein